MKKLLSLMLMLALLVLVTSNATAQEPVGGGEEVEDATEEVVEEVEESVGEPVEEPVSEDAGEAVEEAVEEEVEGVGETVSEPVDDNGEAVEEFEPVGDPGELSAAQLDDSEPDLDAQLASGWVSSIQIINGGTSNATGNVNFYNEAGSEVTNVSLNVGPGLIQKIDASAVPGLPTNYRGAAIVQSDQPIAVGVRQVIGGNDALNYAATYAGISSGGAEVYLPAVVRNYFGYESLVSIQGISGGDNGSINYTLTIFNTDGSTAATKTGTVNLNAGTYIDISTDEFNTLANGDRFSGPAKVESSNGEVAVVVTWEHTGGGNPLGFTTNYEGFTSGATTLYAAGLYDNYFGFISSLNVQNISSVDNCQVTIDYNLNPVNGATQNPNATDPKTITLNAGLGMEVFQPSDNLAPDDGRWTGGATISTNTAGCELVAVVNIASAVNPDGSSIGQAATYSAVSSGSTTVGLPLLERMVDGRFASLTVQNVGTSAAGFQVQYANTNSTVQTVDGPTLQAGGSTEIVLTQVDSLTDGFDGGALVTSDQNIAVIVNIGATGDALNARSGDQTVSYNGVPLQ